MSRRLFARIRLVLHKPLFGIRVIPRDASVDPAAFPEDEYPVHCLKCGYLLRGLPDGKCPECAKEFERGRLLVREYVFGWQGWGAKRKRLVLWLNRLAIAVAIIPFAGLGILWLIASVLTKSGPNGAANPAAANWMMTWLPRALWALMAVIIVGNAAVLAALIAAYPRGAWRRRRAVIAAIHAPQDAGHQ